MEKIPERIKKHIEGKDYTCDDIGKSGANIYIFEDMVLKSEPYSQRVQSGVDILRWLKGRLPVPEVIEHEVSGSRSFLLMSKIDGKMVCSKDIMAQGELVTDILSEAVKMLWNVDISDCPAVHDLDVKLSEARYRFENGLMNMDMVEPDTFGEGGFKDPEELLGWLENNKPECEPVFSHGDLCLPNIFTEDGKVSGFIDLGDCGIGEKWQDLAYCYRSLKHNSNGTYGMVFPNIRPDSLFEKLGIEKDEKKLRYYILLDEFF